MGFINKLITGVGGPHIVFIYIYIRQMPGLCPEPQQPQRGRATNHNNNHHHPHQLLNVDFNVPQYLL